MNEPAGVEASILVLFTYPPNRYTPVRGTIIPLFVVVYAESVFLAMVVNLSSIVVSSECLAFAGICCPSGASLNTQIATPVVGFQFGDNAGATVIGPAVPPNLYIIPLLVFLTRLPGDTFIPET